MINTDRKVECLYTKRELIDWLKQKEGIRIISLLGPEQPTRLEDPNGMWLFHQKENKPYWKVEYIEN